MCAVIFKARAAELDDACNTLAAQLHAPAIDQYGCLEFVSLSRGRKRWYESYRVQVTKVLRAYTLDATD